MKQTAFSIAPELAAKIKKMANLNKDLQLFVDEAGCVVIAPVHQSANPAENVSRKVEVDGKPVKIVKGQIVL
jgi:hypothetical protein